MLSRSDIERLAKLKSEHGILSAYVRMDPRLRYLRQQAATQFKGALKDAERRLQESRWKEALKRESDYVLNFLTSWEPTGQGLAIFSCRPEKLWEILPLEVLVPNRVDVDGTTKTGILAQTLGEFPPYVVAVLQRDEAQIFVAEQGIVEQQAEVASEVPGKHEQGGRAQMRFQRHIEFHVAEHLRQVAEHLKKLVELQPFKIAIGGTEETVTELLKILPDPVGRRVIGRFPVDYKHDNEQQVLQRARVLWEDHERSEQNQLVDRVFDAAKSGGQGALGPESTVHALIEKRVQTLVLTDGFAIDGAACTRCDYFSVQAFQRCPLCGAAAEVRDLADRVVEKALLTGAAVEVVAGEIGARLLAEGGVAALLRY